jgi:hypothetical protein
MDTLPDWLLVAALTALRIGVPLAATLLVGYLLARLDARWKAEELARQQRARAAGELPPLARCWEKTGCSEAKRQACAAYNAPLPCWMALRRAEGRMPERCFTCPVFVNA